nr:MAG TPA: hypothetical protein [Caudoviricetes sp.]
MVTLVVTPQERQNYYTSNRIDGRRDITHNL